MGKMAVTGACLILMFAKCAFGQHANPTAYLIKGTVKGVDSGMIKMLSRNGNTVLDSSMIVNGIFWFRGELASPERLLFSIAPGNWSFLAFVENGDIKLSIDTSGAQHYYKGINSWALIWEIKETGSELADVYTRYGRETNQSYNRVFINSLREQLKIVKGNILQESKLKFRMDSALAKISAYQKAWIENYINENPSSVAGAYLLYEFYQSSPDRDVFHLASMLDEFTGSARNCIYYHELSALVDSLKKVEGGKVAPDFTLPQNNGSTFSLSSTRGKYTLIDFWASWCLPCRKAIPVWKEVYAKYQNKGLAIVGLAGDRRRDDWIAALRKERMPWIQVIDQFPKENEVALAAKMFGVSELPFYVLLDKEGKVMLATDDKDTVRKKIEEIFK